MESPFTDLGVLDSFSYSSNVRNGFGMVEQSAVTFRSWGGYKKRELVELLKECKLGKQRCPLDSPCRIFNCPFEQAVHFLSGIVS